MKEQVGWRPRRLPSVFAWFSYEGAAVLGSSWKKSPHSQEPVKLPKTGQQKWSERGRLHRKWWLWNECVLWGCLFPFVGFTELNVILILWRCKWETSLLQKGEGGRRPNQFLFGEMIPSWQVPATRINMYPMPSGISLAIHKNPVHLYCPPPLGVHYFSSYFLAEGTEPQIAYPKSGRGILKPESQSTVRIPDPRNLRLLGLPQSGDHIGVSPVQLSPFEGIYQKFIEKCILWKSDMDFFKSFALTFLKTCLCN